MAWVAVNKDGKECVYQFRPKRGNNMNKFCKWLSTTLICTSYGLSLSNALSWIILGDFKYALYSFSLFVLAALYEIVIELKKLNNKK